MTRNQLMLRAIIIAAIMFASDAASAASMNLRSAGGSAFSPYCGNLTLTVKLAALNQNAIRVSATTDKPVEIRITDRVGLLKTCRGTTCVVSWTKSRMQPKQNEVQVSSISGTCQGPGIISYLDLL